MKGNFILDFGARSGGCSTVVRQREAKIAFGLGMGKQRKIGTEDEKIGLRMRTGLGEKNIERRRLVGTGSDAEGASEPVVGMRQNCRRRIGRIDLEIEMRVRKGRGRVDQEIVMLGSTDRADGRQVEFELFDGVDKSLQTKRARRGSTLKREEDGRGDGEIEQTIVNKFKKFTGSGRMG